jgi:hypothetical protein
MQVRDYTDAYLKGLYEINNARRDAGAHVDEEFATEVEVEMRKRGFLK